MTEKLTEPIWIQFDGYTKMGVANLRHALKRWHVYQVPIAREKLKLLIIIKKYKTTLLTSKLYLPQQQQKSH